MESKQIFAPFTDEQVEGLNKYQHSGAFHEFNCGGKNHPKDSDKILIATNEGWICPNCNYTQKWAWEGMANGGMVNSMKQWREKHGLKC